MSDLSEQLRQFEKGARLRRVPTVVSTEDGRRLVETPDGRGGYAVRQVGACPGYVVDERPDLSVSVVADGLVLGSQDVAADLSVLEAAGVTHILNVGPRIPERFPSRFVYESVEMWDEPREDARRHFDACLRFVERGRRGGGCVLVHCNAGVSRAPTVVAAYLVGRCGMALADALARVKRVRPCARPNDGFVEALGRYEREIRGSLDG